MSEKEAPCLACEALKVADQWVTSFLQQLQTAAKEKGTAELDGFQTQVLAQFVIADSLHSLMHLVEDFQRQLVPFLKMVPGAAATFGAGMDIAANAKDDDEPPAEPPPWVADALKDD